MALTLCVRLTLAHALLERVAERAPERERVTVAERLRESVAEAERLRVGEALLDALSVAERLREGEALGDALPESDCAAQGCGSSARRSSSSGSRTYIL